MKNKNGKKQKFVSLTFGVLVLFSCESLFAAAPYVQNNNQMVPVRSYDAQTGSEHANPEAGSPKSNVNASDYSPISAPSHFGDEDTTGWTQTKSNAAYIYKTIALDENTARVHLRHTTEPNRDIFVSDVFKTSLEPGQVDKKISQATVDVSTDAKAIYVYLKGIETRLVCFDVRCGGTTIREYPYEQGFFVRMNEASFPQPKHLFEFSGIVNASFARAGFSGDKALVFRRPDANTSKLVEIPVEDIVSNNAFYFMEQYRFSAGAKDFENWGGLGERWFLGNESGVKNEWYFITPGGKIYKWNTATNPGKTGLNLALQDFIGWVDPSFHTSLTWLNLPKGYTPTQSNANFAYRLKEDGKLYMINLSNPTKEILAYEGIVSKGKVDVSADGKVVLVDYSYIYQHCTNFPYYTCYPKTEIKGYHFLRTSDLENNKVISVAAKTNQVSPYFETVKLESSQAVITMRDGAKETIQYAHIAVWDTAKNTKIALLGSAKRKDTDNDARNWGGLDERWFKGNGIWYYITPDGAIYKWLNTGTKATLLQNSTLVGYVGPQYHKNLNWLSIY